MIPLLRRKAASPRRAFRRRTVRSSRKTFWTKIAFGVLFIITVAYFASFVKRIAQGESSDAPYPVRQARLQVLNGTGRPGLARKVADLYRRSTYQGVFFDVVDEGNSAPRVVEKTLVVNRTPEDLWGEATAAVLGVASRQVLTHPLTDNVLNLHVTVIVGGDIDSLLRLQEQKKGERAS